MSELHYRTADGIVGYSEGDVLVNDDTGERLLVVRDGSGIKLVPEPKPKGRPPRAHAPGRVLGLRIPDDQRAMWQDAADRLGIELSDWIREACDLAVARGSTR